MRQPETFPRRILLAVTGMSPQVVTETLFALVTEQNFVPTEIRLITTGLGFNRAARDLLDPQDGKFHAFCREYGLVGQIAFDTSLIHVLCDAAGVPLGDIRLPAENRQAADEITRIVQMLCLDEAAALHVSIAGGRKTMGFFVGYALSLFGRAQDRLSHVLVSEPFERNPDFYFPSRVRRELVLSDGRKVNTADAQVLLAEIPLVRLRDGLPESSLVGKTSYSVAVAAAQLGIGAPVSLGFDFSQRSVLCGGVRVKLPPMQFAFMLWMAMLRVAARKVRPGEGATVAEFLAVYAQVVGKGTALYENAALSMQSPEDFLMKFQELSSRAKTQLEKTLGRLAARAYLVSSFGKRPAVRYALTLPPEAIQLP